MKFINKLIWTIQLQLIKILLSEYKILQNMQSLKPLKFQKHYDVLKKKFFFLILNKPFDVVR